MERKQHGIKPEIGGDRVPGVANREVDKIVGKVETSRRKKAPVLRYRNTGPRRDGDCVSLRFLKSGAISMVSAGHSSSIEDNTSSLHSGDSIIRNRFRIAEGNSGIALDSNRNITGTLNLLERNSGAR